MEYEEDDTRFEELLLKYPGRWPRTEERGNTLRLKGWRIIEEGQGEVNYCEHEPTEDDLCEEMDCQESVPNE